MKLIFTPRAERDLANQLEFGERRFGREVARQTLERVRAFLKQTLVKYPKTGFYHPAIQSFETWIPGTPFIIFYRIDETDDAIKVLALYHHAQNRETFEPER